MVSREERGDGATGTQELATYDQLPEFAVELARLLQEGVDEKGAKSERISTEMSGKSSS